MKVIYILVFLSIKFDCFAQSIPSIQITSNKIENFIPNGWEIISNIKQDFNNDRLLDYAIVIQSKDIINNTIGDGFYSQKLLLIIFAKSNNTFQKSLQTNKLFGIGNWGIQSSNPFVKMESDKKYLKLSFSTGGTLRAYMTYYFQYRNNDWILSKYTSAIFEWWSVDSYITEFNFINGVQLDLKTQKNKVIKKLKSTIDENLKINNLENRIYKLSELDASNFIDPFKGDSVFD